MNIKIHIPAWYVHEYLNAIKLLRAILKGEDGAKEIAAIRAEVNSHRPRWNGMLIEHSEMVIKRLEEELCQADETFLVQ